MKIYHLFPAGCPLLTPHFIRSFVAGHEQMGTKVDDHCFIIPGVSPEERRNVYGNLGVPAEDVIFLELRPRTLARFFRGLDSHALLVLHGVYSSAVWAALALVPRLWRRTAWVMWGADVYGFSKRPQCHASPRGLYRYAREMLYRLPRKCIIRRLGAVAGAAVGDFDALQSHCGKLDNFHRVFYSDFVIDPVPPTPGEGRPNGELRVCLGNSATESNRHIEALQWLSRFKYETIKVVCPLSYGQSRYADSVVAAGHDLLGDKFQPVLEVMEREQWVTFLRSLDILIFNHNRQQGLFALHAMLFAGKKCFVRSDVSIYHMLREYDIPVFPTEAIASMSFADFSRPLEPESAETNRRQCQRHLSRDAAAEMWRQLFAHFQES